MIADHQKLAQALLSGDGATAEAIMAQRSPDGEAGFSEFLATLPAEYFNDGPVTLPRETSSSDVGQAGSVQGGN